MNETETLVQRFIDQELSPDERVRFVVRLGRDAALREEVLALERVVADATQLPRPVVSRQFVEEVMRRTSVASGDGDAPTPTAVFSIWRRVVDAFWVPRTLRWNLASAAIALGVIGAVITGGAVTLLQSWPTSTRSEATPSPARMVLVRLVVVQPDAATVAVAGDFNAWTPARTPLERVSDDAWAVTLPLEPGRYEYMFVVDDKQWMADPLASEHSDDGFGSRNAVLDVRPPVAPL